MLHKFFEKGDWFAPKRLGYGAGLPIAWQGWVLLLGYITVVIVVSLLAIGLPEWGSVIAVSLILILTIPFLLIVKRRTRGGWRWRSGGKD